MATSNDVHRFKSLEVHKSSDCYFEKVKLGHKQKDAVKYIYRIHCSCGISSTDPTFTCYRDKCTPRKINFWIWIDCFCGGNSGRGTSDGGNDV